MTPWGMSRDRQWQLAIALVVAVSFALAWLTRRADVAILGGIAAGFTVAVIAVTAVNLRCSRPRPAWWASAEERNAHLARTQPWNAHPEPPCPRPAPGVCGPITGEEAEAA